MSSPVTDTATQQNLSLLTDIIESKIQTSGFEIPRPEIIGYLLEFIITDDKLDEMRLNELVGSVEKISTEIVALRDIQWPEAPWYGKEIKYPLEATVYKNINRVTSSQFMNFYRYFQMVLMLPSIFILIMVVLSFSLALIRGDPNSFTISIGISTNSLGIFYYYGIHSIINFPITSRISNNKQLRAGVDDMESWLYNMKKLSYFQTFSFISFSLLMFIGSFAEVEIRDAQIVNESHPANGIPLTITLLHILYTSFVYFYGISKLNNNASGRILKAHLSKPSRHWVRIGLSIITFTKSLITLVLANIWISFLGLINSFEDGAFIETHGVETFFTILVIIYLSLEIIIFGYMKYAIPTLFSRLLRKNNIRINFIQILNWIIFVILYSFLFIRLKFQEIDQSTELKSISLIQDYFVTLDFLRILILTLLQVVIVWFSIIFTKIHKGNEFDDEISNIRDS